MRTIDYLKLRKRQGLDQAWQSYRLNCLGTAIDERDVELAFKAGAVVLFHAMMQSISAGDGVTEQDERYMAAVTAELDRFAETFDEEIRKRRGLQ